MVDAVDQCLPFGDQTGDNQRGRGAQIGGHDGRPFQPLDAAHDGVVAFDLNIGAQAHQFVDVHETVFEDRFTNGGHAVGNAVDGHELGLHVGRESRIRRSTQADRFQSPGRHQADRVTLDGNFTSCIHQLVDHRVEVGCGRLEQADIAPRCRRRAQIGAGLDTVRHDGVRSAMQLVYALDANDVGAGAGNAGAHGNQAVGQIDHLRFTRRVLDDGLPLGQAGGHHQVLGTGHGNHVGTDSRPLQAGRLGMDIALLDLDLGTHGLQALDVLVDRPRPDSTTTRQRHAGFAAARDQGTKHQNGGAHGLDHLVRGDRIVQPPPIEHQSVNAIHRHPDPHVAKQAQHGRDVVEVRDIGEMHRLCRQQ